ncbi:sugar kinase [Reyranella sp.]|jgi:2-dehydro-3-deoxygluconokinase|uniref:sugar kinase n=1 Tax=Reyranella sp. TaxID=1929291 RepID=UPI000BCC1824|nr:sugar kinase [Reyranella sp.]OYY44205.1 MAG: 2-dehydro-3-deoxygluconokinase [Rhodospirillales bacterium 35-66-84]OYZ94881.1 MAG: 2-dehydro-3-deoxygluconokinase [Rhodospirillales bacterium 24-66-33]OZB26044.1 MAG: 2-dehydro-3-deoxygluconokinase [Rhodospirillales bacterium 39-66-50]HQS15264.1 sugar kinase [Reyranella sp.]HQT11073.1 sugar kinase [Reyranella sp.]
MTSSPDIVCLGEPLIEFNRPKEGDGRTWLQGFGGDSQNVAIAAARQGASTGYLTSVGQDWMGDAFLDLWKSEGVDASRVTRHPTAPTGVSFVTHSAAGHKFDYLRKNSAASLMTPDMLPADYIMGARVFHLSAIGQAISDSARATCDAALEIARKAGVKVSYDTNLRLRLWELDMAREVIDATIARCDIALPSLDDSQQLTGLKEPEAIAAYYLELGAPLVALKLGAEGSLIATRERQTRIAPHLVEAVDATGAGDTFDGAFLTRLLDGDDAETAARYANVAAALSTTGYGAVTAMPRATDVLTALTRAA